MMHAAHPVATGFLVFLAALFSFSNGAKDGANALATIVTSRALSARTALGMVCLAEFAGPFIFGIAVARTIGANVVDPGRISLTVVLSALLSANGWNLLMWKLGLPSSSSHALVGGLVGSVLLATAFDARSLHPAGLLKIAGGLFLAPVIAFTVGFLIMKGLMYVLRGATPRVNWFFVHAQLVTTLGLALSHGANDAPKSMGMLSLGLVAAGVFPAFYVPLWNVVLAAGAIALGTLVGGIRTIRTIGVRFYRPRPFQAFNSQLSAALISVSASLLGSPVSTSQLMSSAIVGVGGAQRMTKVRWTVLMGILAGWLLTLPATAAAAALVYDILSTWLGR